MTTSKRNRHDSYVAMFKENERLKKENATIQVKREEEMKNYDFWCKDQQERYNKVVDQCDTLRKKNEELIHAQAETDRTWANKLATMQKQVDDKNKEYANLVEDFKKVVEKNNQLEGMNRNQEVEIIRLKNQEANLERGCNLAEAAAEFFRDRCKYLESHFWVRIAHYLHIIR